MKPEPAFDGRLWFTMGTHCSGKHYLIGNPHTFNGRMLAWCPTKQTSFFVSKLEMDDCSVEAEFWVKGFLAGNEPEPPKDENLNVVDSGSSEYQRWLKAIELFARTGYWYSGERRCESCGEELLPSLAGNVCKKCKK